ncbi:MAG: hypothetical protein MZV65_39870 [Chromatiales bacterium]|nr:hypothetical protein [Chromatiales bacterium]
MPTHVYCWPRAAAGAALPRSGVSRGRECEARAAVLRRHHHGATGGGDGPHLRAAGGREDHHRPGRLGEPVSKREEEPSRRPVPSRRTRLPRALSGGGRCWGNM